MYRLCMKAAPRLFEGCGCGCMTRYGCMEERPCGHPRKEEDIIAKSKEVSEEK